jgi:hypothetical protein
MITLKRDNKEVLKGDWFDVYKYIHKTHSFSTDHALKYEGYTVEEGEE